MSLLFAAIGATVAALLEASLVQYISVGDAAPHPVLLGGVIWAIVAGIDRGIAWAFVGGIVLDSLLGRPLGGSSFALLVAHTALKSCRSLLPITSPSTGASI